MIASSRFSHALALAAMLPLVALPATGAVAQTVGVAAAVRNSVEITPKGAARPKPLAVRAQVAMADQIRTRPQSQAQVLLLDKSAFTIGANAVVTIDRFVYDPGRNNRLFGATVARGAFRFASGRPRGGSASINTPIASMGIRGTIVEGSVGQGALDIAQRNPALRGARSDPDTATLLVLRGPGPNQQGKSQPGQVDITANGKVITLNQPGQAVYVPGSGMAPIQFRISQNSLKELQQSLNPALVGLVGGGTGPADSPSGSDRGNLGQGGGTSAGSGVAGARGGGSWLVPGLSALIAVVAGTLIAAGGKDKPTSP